MTSRESQTTEMDVKCGACGVHMHTAGELTFHQCEPRKTDTTTDPMEKTFEEICGLYGIKYQRDDDKSGLDFYLPDYDTYVEVKQFHSDRIGEQMSRRENVICIQGGVAMHSFNQMLVKAYNNGAKDGR